MATKQVQSFEEYVMELPHSAKEEYMPYMVNFIADMYKVDGSRAIGRISFDDIFDQLINSSGVITFSNVSSMLSGKYLEIDDSPYGTTANIGVINSVNGNNGVFLPDGISFQSSKSTSFIGNGNINPSTYGDSTSSSLECNVCNGTFGMDTVYIKDLYVKNLHTADSSGGSSSGSGSSSEMDEATISTLTSDTIFVKEIRTNEVNNIIKIRNGITFSGNIDYSSIKYQKVNFYYLGYDGLRELEANYCCGIFAFRDDVFTGGNLYAHDVNLMQSDASTISLQEKIKSLEARIAALEAK